MTQPQEYHKNIPSPPRTNAGNSIVEIAGGVLMTGIMMHSGNGTPALVESGGVVVSTSGVQTLSVKLSELAGTNLASRSGVDAFYKTALWIRGSTDWRYSTHKKEIFGSGKTGFYPVDAGVDEIIPVNDLNEINVCGVAGDLQLFFKVYTIKSEYNRLQAI